MLSARFRCRTPPCDGHHVRLGTNKPVTEAENMSDQGEVDDGCIEAKSRAEKGAEKIRRERQKVQACMKEIVGGVMNGIAVSAVAGVLGGLMCAVILNYSQSSLTQRALCGPFTMTLETVPEPRTHDDYHVRWVCALPTEQTAAIAMLDQRHAGLLKPPNNNNTYILGCVGKHSVVIAYLPNGKFSTVLAATVTTNIISTFPNIKFCLMVDVGLSIPPKQAHAAAIAAAFAKELLGQVHISDGEIEPTAKNILSQIHETCLKSATNIREVKRKIDRKEDIDILEWLTPVNYGTQHMINELTALFGDNDTVGIAYIYGNYQRSDEQKVDHLLHGILRQLVQDLSSMPVIVKSLYKKHYNKGTQASIEEVSATVQSVADLFTQVYIIVDALDELKATEGCRNRFLEEILKVQAQCNAKVFATSRFVPEITEILKGGTTIEIRAHHEDARSFLGCKVSQSGQLFQAHREVIVTEIAKAVDGMFLLAHLHFQFVSTKKTLKKIKDALKALSSGSKAYDIAYKNAIERIASQDQDSKELAMQVLSWVTCARRVLRPSELRHTLAIEEGDVKLNKENIPQINDMVSVCSGLVTVDKKSGVIRLAHYTTQEYLDRARDQWFPNAESEITMVCIRYLSLDVFKGRFCTSRDEYKDRLKRYPFNKYASHIWGHHALTASMDGDQMILDLLESPFKLSASVQAIMAFHPDALVQLEESSLMATEVPTAAIFGLSNTVLALLENGHPADSKGVNWPTPLSYAATYGQEEVVKILLSRDDVDPNSEDKMSNMTSLCRAAKRGNTAIVKMLLAKQGISADHKGLLKRTLLSFAAQEGHLAVVRLLLSRLDVDPNSTDAMRRTPLSLAAGNRYTAVVQALLKKEGVLADQADIANQTPLSFAARNGHEAVVRLLLATDIVGANRLESCCRDTALDCAVAGGHERVVELLLTRTQVARAGSLLGSAASKGYERILRLLVNSSAIPDQQSKLKTVTVEATHKRDDTLLHWAVENEQLAVVETLLQKGTPINAERWTSHRHLGREGKEFFIEESNTALHLAAGNGQEAMICLLLNHGAGIDDISTKKTTSRGAQSTYKTQDSSSRRRQGLGPQDLRQYTSIVTQTAVHLAAEGGHKAVVALLLRRGAKVCPVYNSRDFLEVLVL
ncbi:ankyrin repeat [Fusarium tjaetaba]|uniref:Ankyrin repeat n=1 Tax=Fusarium tjaetaba TaxID=1567544 RepID=A0A8H5VZE3_9HYPO|nr:ankyrin repeat [Fusarium tjaetaba]KAF5639783.1 ankyrin repeat [Fusarium tjaetaba]